MKFRIASIIRNERIDATAFQNPESLREKEKKLRDLVNTYIYDIQDNLTDLLINILSFSKSFSEYVPYLKRAVESFSKKESSRFNRLVNQLLTDVINYKKKSEESIEALLTFQANLQSAIIELSNEFKNPKEPKPIDENKKMSRKPRI